MQVSRQNARLFRSAQHHCASAITKQDDGTAIVRIQRARKHVCTNHQCTLHRAVLNVLIGNAQRVGETGAGCSQIESRTIFNPEHLLHLAGRTWECVARSGGRHNDQPDIFFSHTCHFQRFFSSMEAHRRHCFISGGNAAFTDTGASDDPLVRGIHHFFKVSVGAHLYG
ncbi:hypothetical protein D3C72_1467360 [compost metagenome]